MRGALRAHALRDSPRASENVRWYADEGSESTTRTVALSPPMGCRICEPGDVLDRLRWLFPFVVALLFPLAGVVLAAARFVEGDREDGRRLAGVTLLGASLYALFFFG
jgi:hypothetical protein